jgi:hypothetical protein
VINLQNIANSWEFLCFEFEADFKRKIIYIISDHELHNLVLVEFYPFHSFKPVVAAENRGLNNIGFVGAKNVVWLIK